MPAVLNAAVIGVLVPVLGTPPAIVHLIESKLPDDAVDVLVNVKLPPAHTVVSLAVNDAVGIGVEPTLVMFILSI